MDDKVYTPMPFPRPSPFFSELEILLNRYSKESASNTPDFLLAEYIEWCLEGYAIITNKRERWYGRDPRMGLRTEP